MEDEVDGNTVIARALKTQVGELVDRCTFKNVNIGDSDSAKQLIALSVL